MRRNVIVVFFLSAIVSGCGNGGDDDGTDSPGSPDGGGGGAGGASGMNHCTASAAIDPANPFHQDEIDEIAANGHAGVNGGIANGFGTIFCVINEDVDPRVQAPKWSVAMTLGPFETDDFSEFDLPVTFTQDTVFDLLTTVPVRPSADLTYIDQPNKWNCTTRNSSDDIRGDFSVRVTRIEFWHTTGPTDEYLIDGSAHGSCPPDSRNDGQSLDPVIMDFEF